MMTRGRRTALGGVGLAVVLTLGWHTPPAAAQDPMGDGPVTPSEAEAIRDTLTRPPGRHAADWVDVAEFPLKVIGWPLDLFLVRFPGWLAGELTAPRPPSPIVRAYMTAKGWGLKPSVRSTIGPRSGAAIGLQMSRFNPLYVHAAVSHRLSQRYRAGLQVRGRTTWLVPEAKWQRDAETPFYGIGPQTDAGDRAFYSRDWWDVVVHAGWAPTPAFSLAGGVAYERNTVGDPISGDVESVFETYSTESLYGATEDTEYGRFELSAALDLTRMRDFQRRGVTVGVASRIFVGLDDTDSDFHLLTGYIQTYLPVNPQQTLALRAVHDIARGDGGEGLPFYHLSTLGGSRSSLGFPSNRFVDRDMLALMSEYRFEIWRELHSRMRAETFLFFHYGAVGRSLGEMSSDDWHPSYGFGFRLSRPTSLMGLAYLGFSGERMTAGIRGSWPF
jgi:hypothetical protein